MSRGSRLSKLEFGEHRRAHYLLGRNAIRLFSEDANEICTGARNDKAFELVRPKIVEKLADACRDADGKASGQVTT